MFFEHRSQCRIDFRATTYAVNCGGDLFFFGTWRGFNYATILQKKPIIAIAIGNYPTCVG
jgi:hypothetical protein